MQLERETKRKRKKRFASQRCRNCWCETARCTSIKPTMLLLLLLLASSSSMMMKSVRLYIANWMRSRIIIHIHLAPNHPKWWNLSLLFDWRCFYSCCCCSRHDILRFSQFRYFSVMHTKNVRSGDLCSSIHTFRRRSLRRQRFRIDSLREFGCVVDWVELPEKLKIYGCCWEQAFHMNGCIFLVELIWAIWFEDDETTTYGRVWRATFVPAAALRV